MIASLKETGHVELIPYEDRQTVTADWYTQVGLPSNEMWLTKSAVWCILLHYVKRRLHTAARTLDFL